MISVFLMGGLGNQLFQIFTIISYGFQEKVKFIFPYAEVLTTGAVRPTYWTNFLSRLIPFTAGFNNKNPTNQDISTWHRINEFNFNYNQLPPLQESVNYILVGYWQSYKYFYKVKDNIFRLIQLKEMREAVIQENIHYFGNIQESPESDLSAVPTKTISMHFRLGDYKKFPESHPILPREYYHNALTKIKESNPIETNYKILYFCEKEDNETVLEIINYLKMLFDDTIFIKVDDSILDWKQLLLMSACNYNIIANSSFSWWAAYMNSNEDKIVCYPIIWFGPKILSDTSHDEYIKDMFPEDWICVANS